MSYLIHCIHQKMNTTLILYFFILTALTSCGFYYQHLEGIIIDSSNHLPIDSVVIYDIRHSDHRIFSDSLGRFDFYNVAYGSYMGRSGLKMSFGKDGYKPFVENYSNSNKKTVTIILSKEPK